MAQKLNKVKLSDLPLESQFVVEGQKCILKRALGKNKHSGPNNLGYEVIKLPQHIHASLVVDANFVVESTHQSEI